MCCTVVSLVIFGPNLSHGTVHALRFNVSSSADLCNLLISLLDNQMSTDVKRAAAPVKSGAYNAVKFHANGLAEGIKPFFMRAAI